MFSLFLFQAFTELGVPTIATDIKRQLNVQELRDNPTDVILAHTYHDSYTLTVAPILAQCMNTFRLTASFMEVALHPVDVPFVFFPAHPQGVVIPAPFYAELMPVVSKIPKTVLLDHDWGGKWDWTADILKTLAPLTGKFDISRIDGTGKIANPPGIKRLPHHNFHGYIKATESVETFIVTHAGSYNATVIDMLSRGTRVLSPIGHLPEYNLKRFGIPTFSDMKGLTDLLETPYDEKVWGGKRALCTDIRNAVRKMDSIFKERLGTCQTKN
jgi:hypothetical protein